MKQRAIVTVAMLLALGALAGCAQGAPPAGTTGSAEAGSPQPQPTDHLVFDTGVESTPRGEFHADWPVNVNDAAVLREFSSAVIAGKVIGVEGSYVDANAVIVTSYSVQVEEVYKGENIAEVISVVLPGGSLPLGEYISELDALGLYDMKLGQKGPELLSNAGLDPSGDPRAMDPATPVTENWGMNPASESAIAELQPDSWVFYIGALEGDVHYGAAFDHALSYLKEGLVYSLHPEAEGSPVSESELVTG